MDELFFGGRKRTPTIMCRKALSLPKLRKLAMEHDVNIYSEARTAVSKRTGLPKKPKMVSCATLKNRLRKAGLDHVYKRKRSMPSVDVNMPEMHEMREMPDMVDHSLFDDDTMSSDGPVMVPVMGVPVSKKSIPHDDEPEFTMVYGNRYMTDARPMAGARPKKSQKHAGVIVVKGRTHHVFRGKEGGLYYMKGKSGAKIYIDKKRLKKKSPKRK